MIAIVKIFEGGKTTIEESDGNIIKVGNGEKVTVTQDYCDQHEYLEPYVESDEIKLQEQKALDAKIEKAKADAIADYKADLEKQKTTPKGRSSIKKEQ